MSRAPADQQQTEYDSYAALAEPAPHRAGADGQYQPDLRDDQGPGSGANWGNRSPGYRPGGGTVDTNLFPAPPNFQAVPNQFGRQAPPPLYPPSNPLKHHPPPPSGPFNPQPAADGRSIADSLKEFPHAAITTQIAGLAADGFQNNISKKVRMIIHLRYPTLKNVSHFQIQDYTTFFNIKYYFEVTTTSVYKKLGILVFPFFRRVSLGLCPHVRLCHCA